MHDLKSLGITGVQVRAVCPVGVDDISAAVQKSDANLIVADIFGAGVFHGPFDIEIVSARPRCPVGQNGQVAGRRGTQIFLKRTIVFALLDGVLLLLTCESSCTEPPTISKAAAIQTMSRAFRLEIFGAEGDSLSPQSGQKTKLSSYCLEHFLLPSAKAVPHLGQNIRYSSLS